MTDYLVEDCGSCGAPIIRAVHERTLKPSVIDAAAGTVGNVMLSPPKNEHAPPLYRIVNGTCWACCMHGTPPSMATACATSAPSTSATGPGFDASRTADFIAMDVWPSSGLLLHGHEVKVSRSDWLRELAEPRKAEAFTRYMDRWWVVVPSTRIVRDDLPDEWGLMVRRGDRLAVARPAPPLTPEPVPRTFLASLLRATVLTARRGGAA